MKRLSKSKIIAAVLAICMVFSLSNAVLIASAETSAEAIAAIVGYAGNNNAAALTITQLQNAGVTAASLIAGNLDSYKAAIAGATEIQVDTLAEIQALINNVNKQVAVNVIKAYAIAGNADALTIQQLIDAGATNAINANLTYYKQTIVAKTGAELDEESEVKAMVTTVNTDHSAAAINKIKTYATGVAGGADAMTLDELIATGVTGAIAANLERYKDKIEVQSSTGVDTTAEIQTLVDKANAEADQYAADQKEAARKTAVYEISMFAANDDATALTTAQLVTAGVAADKAILAYIGSHNADITKSTGYIGAIERAGLYQMDTTDEIKAMVDAVNTQYINTAAEKAAAISTIAGFAANDNASGLTIDLLVKAGVENANILNIGTHGSPSTGYIKAIEDATRLGADETSDIQTLINGVNAQILNAAITAIIGYANNDNADALTVSQLLAAGVTNDTVKADNLPLYKKAIVDEIGNNVNDTPKIQTLVNAVNASVTTAENKKKAAIEKIRLAAANDNASGVTIQDLKDTTVSNVIDNAATLTAYQTAIAAATSSEADSVEDIQAIVTSVNTAVGLQNAINVIKAYSGDATAMTIQQLTDVGITGLVTEKLEYYKTAIAGTAADKLATRDMIQAVIDAVNGREANVKIISEYAGNDNASELTIDLLKAAGVTGTVDSNLAQYKIAIAAATLNAASTTAGIQTIINNVNTAEINKVIVIISGYAKNDNASALTIDQLNFIGCTSVIAANIDRYKSGVVGASEAGADSLIDIQAIVDAANTAAENAIIAVIAGYAGADNASALTADMLKAAGISRVVDQNLARYKTIIVNATSDTANSKAEVQDLIDAANLAAVDAAVALIKSYAALDDASALTIDKLAEAGVSTDVEHDGYAAAIAANLGKYKSAIEALNATDVDSTAKIQAIITDINTDTALGNAISKVVGYANSDDASALTIALLKDELGILNTDANYLALYKYVIAGCKGADVDTVAEIQTAVNVANTLGINIAKVSAYATDNTAMVAGDLTVIGITGVLGQNLSAYKVAILAKEPADVDTIAEIQKLVNDVNTAEKNKAVIAIQLYAANDNAANLDADQLTIAGVTNIVAANMDLYRTEIVNRVPNDVENTAKIQAIINNVNRDQAVKTIKGYAGNDDATALTIALLKTATITGTNDAYLAYYKVAIVKATTEEADTVAEIQAIITAVNTYQDGIAALNAVASLKSVKTGTIQGTLPAGSIDKAYLPTLTVNVSSETTINAASFTAEGNGVVAVYANSDFTGAIGDSGVTVTASSTLYVKVVSQDTKKTVYYKVVFNIVNPEVVRYGIAGSEFVKVGSNFEATVTLTRGDAAFLNDPKLLLIYTLSDGQTQVYITQNAIIGENTVVVGAGVTKVDVVLVDGKVDWTDPQSPNRKSLFISLSFPA